MTLLKVLKNNLFTVFLLLGISVSINAEDMKIGVIDFEKVFNSFIKTKEENQKLQSLKENKEKEAQTLIDEINKLKSEAEILSDEAKRNVEKEIRDKLRDLRDFTEDSKKELLEERNIIFQKITKDIRKIIAAKGKKEGFSMIIDDKALFYTADALDVTEDIIKLINSEDSTKQLVG